MDIARPPHGLSTAEALALRARHGENDVSPAPARTPLREVARLLSDPLVLLLLGATTVSAVAGDSVDAFIILGIVTIGISLDFAQSYRARRVVDELRARVAPTATVLRDDTFREIPRA